jgi:hypothetical protein
MFSADLSTRGGHAPSGPGNSLGHHLQQPPRLFETPTKGGGAIATGDRDRAGGASNRIARKHFSTAGWEEGRGQAANRDAVSRRSAAAGGISALPSKICHVRSARASHYR